MSAILIVTVGLPAALALLLWLISRIPREPSPCPRCEHDLGWHQTCEFAPGDGIGLQLYCDYPDYYCDCLMDMWELDNEVRT